MNKNIFVVLLITLMAFSLCLSGCGGEDTDTQSEEKPKITIGSKEFTTQLVKGQLAVKLFEANGFEVEDKTGLGGSTVCREALLNGDIDMYWEYTGTAWMAHLGHDTPITDSEECYQKVKEEDAENGIVWLDYGPQNDTYTVMMRKADADELGIKTISDLSEAINSGVQSPVDNSWTFATDHEYAIREDGLVGLQELYGFEFDDVPIMQVGITYGALRDGKVATAMGFATDGRVVGFDLVNLVDDKNFHPVYNPAPNINADYLEKHPEIEEILKPLIPLINNENMTNLNAKVDLEEMEPDEVAEEFLKEHGLIE
jgi:osmoprotectant transport system substrate-binding protein